MSNHSGVHHKILQQILLILTPVAVAVTISAVWQFKFLTRQLSWEYLSKRCILTVTSVFYIAHFPLAEAAFSIFSYSEVFFGNDLQHLEKRRYWNVDTDVQAFRGNHFFLATTIGVPLLIFVLSFPIIVAWLLIRFRKSNLLRSRWIQETLGFLFNGFEERFVYWDAVILLRKVLLSSILVFIGKGRETTAIFAGMILMFFMFAQMLFCPFRKDLRYLNTFESLSLLCCSTTFFAATGISMNENISSVSKASSILIASMNVFIIVFFSFFLLKLKSYHIQTDFQRRGTSISNMRSYVLIVEKSIIHFFELVCECFDFRFGENEMEATPIISNPEVNIEMARI